MKALLIGIYRSSKEKEEAKEHIEELNRLCDTYGLETLEKVTFHLKKINSATFIGKGKLIELKELADHLKADYIVFDDEISPHQQRNLEKIFNKTVIDRTELILGVFEKNARTKEAKIQVELAFLKYQLPRLRRMWTHLERHKVGGGSGGYLKGMGSNSFS